MRLMDPRNQLMETSVLNVHELSRSAGSQECLDCSICQAHCSLASAATSSSWVMRRRVSSSRV